MGSILSDKTMNMNIYIYVFFDYDEYLICIYLQFLNSVFKEDFAAILKPKAKKKTQNIQEITSIF